MMDELALLGDWREPLILAGQILLILLLAWIAQRLVSRGLTRLHARYALLPAEVLLPLRGLLRWLIVGSALMLVLERLGVSAEVLWTALTGFAVAAAVAFFALWSVLSNMFCAVLIYALGPFRLGDTVELLESGDKPGIKGRVQAINLFYTTLDDLAEDAAGAQIQVPNGLFFQRSVRRWR
jgi:small-conductance mechanosensitive channel